MTSVFNKSVANDFIVGKGCWEELYEYELDNAITGKTPTVVRTGDNVLITWNIGLTGSEITIQDAITAAHTTCIPYQAGLLSSVSSVRDSYFSAHNSAGGISFTGSWTDLTWDTHNRVDSDYSHTLGAANITINTTADYDITTDVSTELSSGSSRTQSEMRIVLNGVFLSGTKALMYNRTSAQSGATGSVSIIKTLTAGDVLKVQCIRQAGGGTLVTYPEGCRIKIKRINN